ncbi:glycosyl transferase [Xanthomonas nasturtii]|uniref:glycosyltransferase family 2 protein n=1 Tax=Xanthomonas nasturtii TaxID=1843581 RepID=UPI0007E2EC51|nr:glycosyltransferase [Xanthomonas nasturtii]OAX89341.1 glycosyl transferase [Xanthomonas nasturtii]WVL58258.1 glycosyltransferase [Xanthomonas nasturtii]
MNDQTPARARWPLVSVLIPAFNHARFVQRCLDSVLEDPYPCKEIVIIDDGSSDATGEKISQWIGAHGHRLPVQFVQRENRGVSATLNEAARIARGDYIRIVASDDYLVPGGILVQVKFLEKRSDKTAVIGDACVVDEEGRCILQSAMRDLHRAQKSDYLTDAGIRRAVIGKWAVSGAVTMLRRRAFDSGMRWNESLKIEDWDLFLRLVSTDALAFLDVIVSAYRLHGTNVSKTRDLDKRIGNLTEFALVAECNSEIFTGADFWLLRAQLSIIKAKIFFLKSNYFAVIWHLAAYLIKRSIAVCSFKRRGLK